MASLGLLAALPASANFYTVNVTTDEVDGPCVPGDCSLREAVIAANANPGADEIILAGGQTYSLTIAGTGENAAATGDLDITETLAIYTPSGAGQAIIQAGAAPGTGIDRVFHINPNLANVFLGIRFENLVIRHGTTTANGGGIHFDGVNPASLSQLRLTACRIDANQAATAGGGLWAKDLDTVFFLEGSDPAVPATQVGVRNNIVTAGDGGGMFIQNSPMFINLTGGVSANEAAGNGGGLYYTGGSPARTAALAGVFISNRADRDANGSGDGGGIYIAAGATATLGTSNIGQGGNRGNRAVNGGGIANFGTLSITASGAQFAVFSENRSTLNGAGIYNSGAGATVTASGNVVLQQGLADSDANGSGNGGGVFNNGGTFTMTAPAPGATFLGSNSAVNGGGFATNGGTVTISTVAASGNNAATSGGAFWITGGTVTLCEVTMELNNANVSGGAIFKSGGTLTMNLSRIVSNFSPSGSAIASGGTTPNLENNWWGCDDFPVLQGNPNLAGCQTFTGTIDANPRIDLRLLPTPAVIPPNGSSVLTSDVTRNTDGNLLPFCNGPRPAPIVMEGRQVVFGLASAPLGSINPTFANINNGFAITTFTAGAATGTQIVSATVDIGTQTAPVVIASPVNTSDVSLTKTVNNASPNVGQNITFTITVTNGGPNAAVNLAVRDLLPAGLTFVSASSGAYNSANGIWTIGTLNSGSSSVLTITAAVATAGAKINTAQVSANDTHDPDSLPNNSAAAEDDQASVTVTPQTADLSLNKTVDNAAPVVGTNAVFTIAVTNGGPNTATGVTVLDLLPAGLNHVSNSTVSGSYDPGTGIWTIGSIASGTTVTLTITVNAATTGAKINTAQVRTSDVFDPDSAPNNNQPFEDDQKSVTVNPLSPNADLSLTKTANTSAPPVGTNVTFTITVTNGGPNIATNVSVLDLLPLNLNYVSHSTAQGTYDQTTGIWAIGTINFPGSAVLTITATAATAGPKTNTAQVRTSDQPDGDSTPNNNIGGEDDQASVTVTPPQADLSLAKAVDVPSPGIGQNVTFTLTLNNAGPGQATNVVVTDVLPAGYTFVSANTASGTYSGGTGIWSTGTVNAGSSAVLTITAAVNAGGSKVNVAQVTGVSQSDPDSTPNNNAAAEDDQASATVTVRPGVSKSFAPASIAPGGTSVLTVTLINANEAATTGAAFTDTYPAGLVNAGAASTTCGGTASTPTAGSLQLTAGTIPALGTCTVTVSVTAASSGFYANTIPAGGVTSTNHGSNGTAASATLPVFLAPAITKSFSPASILTGQTSTITITLSNGNGVAINNAAFTDTYPAGLVNAGAASTSCGGTASTPTAGSLSLSGGTIPANGNCTVTVAVTSSAGGAYTNTIPAGGLTSDNGANTVAASDTLTVLGPPTVAKAFSVDAAPVGSSTAQVTITITNPNTIGITGVALTDTMPAGLTTVGAVTGNCNGAAGANGTAVTLSGGSIPAMSSCQLTVNVTSAAASTYTNTIAAGDVTTANAGSNTGTASDSITFLAAPAVAKQFSPSAVAPGVPSILTITLTNANAVDITGAGFTDVYPASVNNSSVASTTCGGTVSTPTADSVQLTGGTIPANGQCTVTVDVFSFTPGTYGNDIPAGAVTSANAGSNTVAANGTLIILGPPAVAKAFTPDEIAIGGTSTVTITLTNDNGAPVTGVNLTDTYPANVVNTATPNPLTTCGGTVSTPTADSVQLTGGTIPANGQCTVTVQVTSSIAGSYDNFINGGDVTTANAPSNTNSATANLAVLSPPALTKFFSPSQVGINSPSTLTISLNNPNDRPVSGIAFTDTYPANLVNAPAPNASTTCGGTVTTPTPGSLQLSGASLPAFSSCSVTVSVVGTAQGQYTNTLPVGSVTTTNAGANETAAESILTVLGSPGVTKSFTPSVIPVDGTSTLVVTFSNPNSQPITNVSFTDTYPANVVNIAEAEPMGDCGGGLVFASGGGGSLALSNGTIPAGGCSIFVDVTSATPGTYVNAIPAGAVTTSNAGSNPTEVSGTLTVLEGLGATKAFAPASIPIGAASTLTITLINSNDVDVTGVQFSDTYDPDIVNAGPSSVSTTCAGSVTGDPGTSTVSLTEGTVPANGSCTVTILVTSSVVGSHPNTIPAGAVTSTNGGANALETTASLVVMSPPAVTKTISPASIGTGGTATLTITLQNTNAEAITGVSFTDAYDPDIDNAASPGVTNSCGGTVTANAGTSSLALGGGTIPAAASCTITVLVTSAVPGIHTNTIAAGSIGTTNAGTNAEAASDDLEVVAAPTVSKSFAPPTILAGGTTTLTITLGNANGDSVTGVSFTDTYPPGIVNAAVPNASTTCGGTVTTLTAGSVALSGGTIPANGTCTVSLNVTSSVAGSHQNTIAAGAVTSSDAPPNTAPANASLLVIGPPAAGKAFAPASVAVLQPSTLTITLTNPNAGTPINGIAFTDTYPSGLVNATPANASTTCGGTVVANDGSSSVALSGGSLAPGGSCTVTVTVVASAAGNYANTIPAGGVTSSDAGSSTTPASATLPVGVLPAPAVTKSFAPSSISIGGTSTLTITLANPNHQAISGVSFTDTYPAGVVNATPANGSTTCGGTLTAASGGGSISLSSGLIPASSSCTVTVTVTVTSSAAGNHGNTIPAGGVSSANAAPNGSDASATLSVGLLAAPSVTKTFAPGTITPGQPTTITITLANAGAQPITGVAFTDNYPSGMINAATPNATSSCGGAVTAAAGDDALTLTGGTVPANGSCTVTVMVVTTAPGNFQNTLPAGSVTSANAAPNAAAVTGTLTAAAGANIPALDPTSLFALVALLATMAVFALRSR